MDRWEGFAAALGEALQYSFKDAIERFAKTSGTESAFVEGQLVAYHHLYTLIVEHAEISEIPLSELSMDGFTEEDFLSPGPKKP